MGTKTQPIPIGSHVRHYGTRQWGTVEESVPQRDSTFEYRIKRDLPLRDWDRPGTWWASYHIDQVEESVTNSEKE